MQIWADADTSSEEAGCEQFGEEVLSYEENPMQLREVHFAKEEKRQRYEYLKDELRRLIKR